MRRGQKSQSNNPSTAPSVPKSNTRPLKASITAISGIGLQDRSGRDEHLFFIFYFFLLGFILESAVRSQPAAAQQAGVRCGMWQADSLKLNKINSFSKVNKEIIHRSATRRDRSKSPTFNRPRNCAYPEWQNH